MRPPGRQTRRISRATFTGSGTTLIEVRRVDDVEGVVGELEIRGVHLRAGARCGMSFARRPAPGPSRASTTRSRSGDRAVLRIERQVDAGADADLEHASPGWMPICWIARSRPGCSVGPKVRS